MLLLNLNDWSVVANLDRRLTHLELPIAFANVFMDMEKMKGAKKICRDAWDLILATFCYSSKRANMMGGNSVNQGNNNNGNNGGPSGGGAANSGSSSGTAATGAISGDNTGNAGTSTSLSSGNGNSNSNASGAGGNNTIAGANASSSSGNNNNPRYSPCPGGTSNLQSFIKLSRHQTVFNLIISMLAKIHNLLKDDANYDINGEYMHLWPTTLSKYDVHYNVCYYNRCNCLSIFIIVCQSL